MADYGQLFRSTEEQATPVEALVTGTIPTWLQGNLVRLGPGKFDLGDFVLNHWFDGYAVLYKFKIENGKVQFSKRFLQSDAYKKAVSVGKPIFTEFGTRAYPDPCKNIFSRMMSTLVPDLTDNDAINIFTLQDSIYVATETSNLHRIDINNLETCEKVDMTKLVGIHLASSHTFVDSDGVYYAMGTALGPSSKHHIVRILPSPSGKGPEAFQSAKILADISSSWMSNISYYHSFGMSENYFIFVEQPLLINTVKLLAVQVKGKCLKDCMEWKPQELNRFVVIERKTGKVVPITYKSTKAFFMFHHINTYEEDGQLVVDVLAMDSPDIVEQMYLKVLRKSAYNPKDMAVPRRFVLPLSQSTSKLPEGKELVSLNSAASAKRSGDIVQVTPQVLSPGGYELPTINSNFIGKKYRYFYASGVYDPGQFGNSIVKVDTETGEFKTWKENEFTYPGESQFVSRPGAVAEDDGVLLAAVTDVRKGSPDFLLVLDARDLSEIARAEVNVHIPNVIHGIFVPNQ